MYHNTVNEPREQAKLYQDKTEKQDTIVKRVIAKLNKPFSAKDIYTNYPVMNTPITSIRRSINTLKNQGLIEETGERVKGLFGRSELQYTTV